MPRTARIWEPGAIHHAVARAHCGSPIFAEDEHRRFVVGRAARVFAETGTRCLAWAVLKNHYHVLLQCEGPPGPVFSRLNTAIACRVVRYRGERGAVFQDRYYNDTCETEESLFRRLAYVLGNPVHHRVVPTIAALEPHPWSGFGEVLGLRPVTCVDVGAVLRLFNPSVDRARRDLVRFLESRAVEWARDDGDPDEDREAEVEAETYDEAASPVEPAAVAGDHTVPGIAAHAPDPEPAACVRARMRRLGWTPDRLVPVACAITSGSADAVRAGGYARPESDARAIVACVAADAAGFTLAETAPIVGAAATTLVEARRRGRALLARLGLTPQQVLARC